MSVTSFHAYIDRRDGMTVVVLDGELDLATRDELYAVIADAEDSEGRLVLDLRGLTFIDASGLHVFVAAADRAELRGHPLAAVRPPGHLLRVFEIARLTGRFEWLDAVLV